jgi:Ser/Thr protein kinase RdoA (MazF antagonist)
VTDELIAAARAAYGWDEGTTVSPGPRGALGRIWRVRTRTAHYALKHSFTAPPGGQPRQELDLTRRAAAAGVRVAAQHPAADGRLLVPAPSGGVLRLYDWIDLRPANPDAVDMPERLGELLARLHRSAPAATGTPEPWYHEAPAPDGFPLATDRPWTKRLARLVADLPKLSRALTPPDPARLLVCHRDLHPENVQTGSDGDLVVLDWDQLGPAEPARELIQTLFAWFSDADRMRACYDAYAAAGGPGRITGATDYTMLLADRLNFLLHETRIATDPAAAADDRAWADLEIDETLRLMPTPAQLEATLTRLTEPAPRP